MQQRPHPQYEHIHFNQDSDKSRKWSEITNQFETVFAQCTLGAKANKWIQRAMSMLSKAGLQRDQLLASTAKAKTANTSK